MLLELVENHTTDTGAEKHEMEYFQKGAIPVLISAG
jgi:hypothetical protein